MRAQKCQITFPLNQWSCQSIPPPSRLQNSPHYQCYYTLSLTFVLIWFPCFFNCFLSISDKAIEICSFTIVNFAPYFQIPSQILSKSSFFEYFNFITVDKNCRGCMVKINCKFKRYPLIGLELAIGPLPPGLFCTL